MTFRLFSCQDCGHKMRFQGLKCGRCYTPKTWYQSPALYYVLIPAILLLLALIALNMLLKTPMS